MRRLIIPLFLLTFGLLWIGISNLWNALRYREPVTVAFDQSVADDLPTYVRLQKIKLLGREALWSNSREGTKIYIPIHSAGSQPTDPVSIILESDDPVLLTAWVRMGGKNQVVQGLKLLQAFAQKTEATGMIHSSPADRELNADLRKLTPLLTERYMVLREGDSPSLGLGVFGTVLGSAFLALLNWIRTRPSRMAEPPQIAEPPLLAPKV